MELKVKVSWLRHSTGCHLDLTNANGNSAISVKRDIPGICSQNLLQRYWMTENYSTAYLSWFGRLLKGKKKKKPYTPPRCLIHKLYKTVRSMDDRRERFIIFTAWFLWLEVTLCFCKVTPSSHSSALHEAVAKPTDINRSQQKPSSKKSLEKSSAK